MEIVHTFDTIGGAAMITGKGKGLRMPFAGSAGLCFYGTSAAVVTDVTKLK